MSKILFKKTILIFAVSLTYGICNVGKLQAQWHLTNIPAGTDIYVATNGSNIFVGNGNGASAFLSSDNGNNWLTINNGLPSGIDVYDFAFLGTNIFAATYWGVYLSQDTGKNWIDMSNGLPGAVFTLTVNGTTIYAGLNQGLYLSNDSGANWFAANNGLTNSYPRAFAFIGPNIFTGTQGGGVFLSTNNANSWVPVNTGLTNLYINALAVIGINIFAGTNAGVYLSSDNGNTWSPVNNGMYLIPDTIVNTLVVNGSKIYAGTGSPNGSGGGGVFFSSNNGGIWTPINAGFTSYTTDMDGIGSLSISATDIWAVEDSGGIWYRPIGEIGCGAYFIISPDTFQLHHYIAINNSSGSETIHYNWNWGDGTFDTIPYPSHTYADSGFYDICLTITDSTGCTSTYCDSSFHAMRTTNTMVYVNVVNPLILGTGKMQTEMQDFKIYPNPAKDELFISSNSFSGRINISITDVFGQDVYSSIETPNGVLNKNIDISSFSSGIYFVRISDKNGMAVLKFVKE